jgi:hypothetical protein
LQVLLHFLDLFHHVTETFHGGSLF